MYEVKYWKTTDGKTFQDEKEANDWQKRIDGGEQDVVYYTSQPLTEEGKKRIAKKYRHALNSMPISLVKYLSQRVSLFFLLTRRTSFQKFPEIRSIGSGY